MIIGIPVSTSKNRYLINEAYVDYVAEAGMEPHLITPANNLKSSANLCDGLILAGGIDIDPVFYGEDNDSSYCVDPEKDEFERRVMDEFLSESKPIFGICRGFQLIAREYLKAREKECKWLTFCQHVTCHSLAKELSLGRKVRSHGVYCSNALYGGNDFHVSKPMFVNSMHHQCLLCSTVKKMVPKNTDFKVLASTHLGLKQASQCDVVEAFTITNLNSKVSAVQWHPEELKDYALIQSFFGIKTKEKETVEINVFEGSK